MQEKREREREELKDIILPASETDKVNGIWPHRQALKLNICQKTTENDFIIK